MISSDRHLYRRAWDWLMPGLPWLCLVLMPFKRLVEAPMLIMAGLGLWLLVRGRVDFRRDPAVSLFSAVFACMWLPMLVSLPDAVEPAQTFRVVASHLRFFFAGLFVLHALSSPAALGRFLRLSAWLLVFWLVDAMVQWQTGIDILGRLPVPRRITGPFGPESAKFGVVLAVLTPLLVEHGRRNWPRWALALAILGTAFVVFIGGTRSGWICGLVVAGSYWVLWCVHHRRVPWRATLAGAGIGAVLAAAAISASSTLAWRFQEVVDTLTGERRAVAFEHRRWIMHGGWNMFLAQPVNGVGARGFRYAFPAHAAPGDPYMAEDPPHLPTHSHQVLLEILTETGLVGLVGLLLAGALLLRAAARAPPSGRPWLMPFGLALVCAFWPLNTHPALYSAAWSTLVWWLVALYCAAYGIAIANTRAFGTP